MSDFARFDARRYPTVPVREGYGEWAPTYEATVEDAMDIALLERVESVAWGEVRRVADLGCGTGRTGAWLRTRGVSELDGVDVTPQMLAAAREKGLYESLVEADVTATGLAEQEYGLVTCCLVDEHLPTLGPLYAEAARLLRPDGSLVLVGYHPYFIMAAGMPTHFEREDRGPAAIETHLHLLGEHVSSARRAGLSLAELHERVIDGEWIRLKPKWERYRDWPISFVSVYRR